MPGKARLARSVARAEAAALPRLPSWPRPQPRAWIGRLAPTRRSLLVGLGVLALALGGYLFARGTSIFAIDRIEVKGASPQVAGQVRHALASFAGKSLVGLDGGAVLREVEALPTVVRASYDRDFPHTLRITVVRERPAAIVRSGPQSWLVSVRGRVIEPLSSNALPRLPRIWIATRTPVRTGAELTAAGTAVAARALGRAGAFAARVSSASYSDGLLVFHLRSGLQLLLGDGSNVALKAAVAARVLTELPSGSAFLDVSVPGRPVSGTVLPAATGSDQSSSRG
jgi:cell division protein FtsQ